MQQTLLPLLYFILNILSGVSIIFANKALFVLCQFNFISALAFFHAVVTVLGLQLLRWQGLFTRKTLPWTHTLPLAAVFVGYVAGWNLTLQLNSVGCFQLSKIMVTPVAAYVDFVLHGARLTRMEMLAVLLLISGVALASVTDYRLGSSLVGLLVSAISVFFTSIYQV